MARRSRRLLALSLGAALAAAGTGGCSGSGPDRSAAGADRAAAAAWEDAAPNVGLQFEHRTGATRELNILQATGSGCGWLDYDGDGWLDAVLVQGDTAAGGSSRLFRSVQGRRFEDVTDAAGLKPGGYGLGVAVGDYDGDGRPDLYFCNHGESRLYRNEAGGRFRDVTASAGVSVRGFAVSAAFFDADGDGDEDLYVARYARFTPRDRQLCNLNGVPGSCPPRYYESEPDVFFRNEGGGRFRDATAASGFRDLNGRGLGVAPVDHDQDGDLDLFVANDGTADQMWVNDGRGRFRDQAVELGCAFDMKGKPTASMGAAWGDVDGDERLDLAVGNFQNEPTSLFLGMPGGALLYSAAESGLSLPTIPILTFGLGWLDWDNDGDLDLLQTNGHVQDRVAEIDAGCTFKQSRQLLENDGMGRFSDRSEACGTIFTRPEVGRGLALGDWDNDGRLDALVNNLDGAATLLRNLGPRRHWLGVSLRDGNGRPVEEGALVRCVQGGRRWLRHATRAAGFAGARDARVHFGLADGEEPCALEVTWPGGAKTRVDRVPPDRYVVVRQGSGTAVSERGPPGGAPG